MIGPLAENQHDMLGPWWGAGRDGDVVTVFDGINTQSPSATYAEGCKLSNAEPPHTDPEGCGSDAGFAEAAAANAAEQVVLALGETREDEWRGGGAQRSTCRAGRRSCSRRSRRPASRMRSCCSTVARSRSRT